MSRNLVHRFLPEKCDAVAKPLRVRGIMRRPVVRQPGVFWVWVKTRESGGIAARVPGSSMGEKRGGRGAAGAADDRDEADRR